MTRAKKIISSICLVAIVGFICFELWDQRRTELGGYETAGLQPIPGAEMITVDHHNETLMEGGTVWIYKLPAGYTQQLYKDCGQIEYKKGTYRDAGASVAFLDDQVKPGTPGCYLMRSTSSDTVTVQFTGDTLLVSDIF